MRSTYFLILAFVSHGMLATAQSADEKMGNVRTIMISATNNSRNGPIKIKVDLEYQFWKETFNGNEFYLGITYKTIRLSSDQNGGFRMNDKVYLPNILMSQDSRGYQGFDKIRVEDVSMPISVAPLGKIFTYNSNYTSRARIAVINKTDNINSFTLQNSSEEVATLNFSNDSELRERVEALDKRNTQNISGSQNSSKISYPNPVQSSKIPAVNVQNNNTNINNNLNQLNNSIANTLNNSANNLINNTLNKTINNNPIVNDIAEQIRNQRLQSEQIANAVDQSINQLNNDLRAMGSYNQGIEANKQRLNEVSQLSGNYNSIEEIEKEFASKMSSIKGITNSIESQQNSKLNYAVASKFNANPTEMAVGQGIKLVGSIINGAKAAKDAREAAEALRLQKEAEIKRFEEEKRKAILGMRNELFKKFPDGNPPPPGFKTDKSIIYFFSYITEKSKIEEPIPSIVVTSIFPVEKFEDGTFPYKSTILNKLNGLAPGNISIVGHFDNPERAEEIRKLFVRLSESSQFNVRQVQLKTNIKPATGSPVRSSADFWENGKKPDSTLDKKKIKKDSFWEN